MKKIVAIGLFAALFTSVFTVNQQTEAVSYEANQSNFKYVKERVVEPVPGKTTWWKYLIKVCADDHSLAIAEVVLSSDMEILYQGVHKVIPKGECSHYGAVMKAKNGNTMGYKITQTHEAAQKILDSKQGKLSGTSWPEIMRYKFILGFY